ncbi:36103_t:CDS:2, partial [Racocetra persica]
HTFKSDLRKLFNQNGIIAHIIQVTEGDGGLDLLLSYQGYYAVRVGRKPGIYMLWEKYKEQIHEYPGALYKKFNTKQQAEDFIKQIDDKNKLLVWTDGYCFNCKEINGKKQYLGKLNSIAGIGVFFADNNNRNLSERLPGEIQTNNRAKLYAVIRALEIVDEQQDIIINTDSMYVINSYNNETPKQNTDLVFRLNDLIKKRKDKTYFNHVKGHSGNYGNEQADRLAYLGLKKKFTRLEIPISKRLINHYFIKKSVDNSENA